MKTLDLHKELKYLYAPSAKKAEIVQVPRFKFIMIDGAIEPGQGPGTSPIFQEAMQAMYGVAYTLKFTAKLRKDEPVDYPVMALEGLWWIEGGEFRPLNPMDLAHALVGIVNSFVFEWIISRESYPLISKLDTVLEIFLGGVRQTERRK